jgi:hypothetical protein
MATGGTEVPDGLVSESSSIATTIVPLSQGAKPSQSERPESDGNNPEGSGNLPGATEWAAQVDRAFLDADDLVLPYQGKKVLASRADSIRSTSDELTKILRDGFPHCDPARQVKIVEYHRNIVEVCVELEEISFSSEVDTQQSPAAASKI